MSIKKTAFILILIKIKTHFFDTNPDGQKDLSYQLHVVYPSLPPPFALSGLVFERGGLNKR